MSQIDHSPLLLGPGQLALQLKIERLTGALYQILRACPAGLSEHALLKKLQAPEWAILEPIDYRDPAKLYPVHFLLFHALYRLQDNLLRNCGEKLAISALEIVIQACGPTVQAQGSALPDRHDALAVFYLDLDNLRLSSAVIDSMLDNFWRGIEKPQPQQLEHACGVLDIVCPPDDLSMANRQFRRLAMTHHPDRGGDNQRLQQINQAIAVIRQHLRQTI